MSPTPSDTSRTTSAVALPASRADLGEHRLGVFTRREALHVMSAGEVRGALRGEWQQPWRSVYAYAGVDLDPWQHAHAATAAVDALARSRRHPRLLAVAAGRTAARAWGLPLVDDDDPATGAAERHLEDVACPVAAARLEHDGRVLTARRSTFHDGDVLFARGVRVTSPLRTVVDCAQLVSTEALVCLMDSALHQGRVTRAELEAAVRERKGTPGVTALRAGLELADGRAESPLESLGRLLLLPVLPGLVPQVVVLDATAQVVARLDLGDVARRFGVELDGASVHGAAPAAAADRWREQRVREQRWRLSRATWHDVRVRAAQTRSRILADAARA